MSTNVFTPSVLKAADGRSIGNFRGSLQDTEEKMDFQIDRIKLFTLKDPALYRSERETNLSHFKELMKIFQVS